MNEFSHNQLTTLDNELKQLSNKEIAKHSQRFFKTGKGQYGEGDQFLGIRVPVLRKLAKKYNMLSIDEAYQCLTSVFHEQRLLALFILIHLYQKADSAGRETIYRLYLANTEFVNNWDLVDCSAEHIVGAHLRESDKSTIYELAYSDNLWERRISIMSTFHFIKHNEFDDTLKIAEIVLGDKQDLIHKAVGWMLREVGKRDMMKEEEFLKKHYKNMPRTMLRYAIEKFPEEKRQCYLKGKL